MTKTIYINEVLNAVIIGGDCLRTNYVFKTINEDVEINIGGITYSLKRCIEQYHNAVLECSEIEKNESGKEEKALDARIAKDIVADLKNDLYHLSDDPIGAKLCALNKKINDISIREHKTISEIFQLAGEDWAMFDTIKQAIYKFNTLERRLDKKTKKSSKKGS